MYLPDPYSPAMDSAGARLRKKREDRGYDSARSAALAFGWVVSTYTHHENGTRPFGQKAAEKYARAFGTTAEYLMFGGKPGPSPTTDVPVLGEVATGVWRETDVDFMDQVAEKLLDIPMPKGGAPRGGRRFAVRVADASVNKALLPGEFAVCASVAPGKFAPGDAAVGDLLLIERSRRGLKEVSIRRVSAAEGSRLRLAAHSTDARLTGEITYPSPGTNDRITVLARVVGKYADL